jgi:hypothetical protein
VRVVLTSSDKGNIAETAITAHAVRLGIVVLKPLNEGRRYDLVFDIGPRLLRVKCKWARRREDIVCVPLATSRLTPTGHVRTTYTADEVDLIAAYCLELDACFALPIVDVQGATAVHLRTGPAKNNQSRNVRWATAYSLGAIAQLGERRAGSAKVGGSNPPSSIA